MRERVSEIERYWTASENENGPEDLQPTYLEAFVLASEQLVLSQKLEFQAGIECYVILHNVEASSGLLEEIQKATNKDFTKDMRKIVVSLLFLRRRIFKPIKLFLCSNELQIITKYFIRRIHYTLGVRKYLAPLNGACFICKYERRREMCLFVWENG